LAAGYVRAIVEAQPTGSIRLCGYSAGGGLALSVARGLRAAGRDVALLALLDPAFGFSAAGHGLYTGLSKSVNQVLPHSLARRSQRLLATRAFLTDRGLATVLGAARDIPQEPFAGEVTLLLPRWSHGRLPHVRRRWRRLARGGLSVRVVPGHHRSFIRPPHADATAEELAALLAKAWEAEGDASREETGTRT
jgi:thioesterase domain-containing protein